MIILCTGMMRSGSSWSYNAVRLLMKENSPKIASGYADDIGRALAESRNAEHVIIKTHKPDGLGRALIRHHACRIVHSFRQPIETMASMMQSYDGDFDRQLTAIEAGFDILRFELDCGGVHFIWYDEILHHGARRVQALAEYLGLDVPDAVIQNIAHNLSREMMIKATTNLPAADRRQPIGRFLWTNKDALSKGLIRNAPKPADKILNTAQRKWLSEKMVGLVDDKGELLDLVKNIGCIATYYHQGQVIAEGESPPVIQAPVAPPPPPTSESEPPKKPTKSVASVGNAVSLTPPPLSDATLAVPPIPAPTASAPTGLALSAISRPPPPSGMVINTALKPPAPTADGVISITPPPDNTPMDITILSRPPELPPDFDLGFIEIPLHAAPRPEFDSDHTASGARPGPGHIKGLAPSQVAGVAESETEREESAEPPPKRRLRHPRPPSINETI